MISAERFARERTSYWHQLLPRLEPFVRLLNLSAGRFSPPLAASVAPERRALVAELGFELFRVPTQEPIDADAPHMAAAVDVIRERIARLSNQSQTDVAPPTFAERTQAAELANRLTRFVLRRAAASYEVDPEIRGCGEVDNATADLLIRRAKYSFDPELDVMYDALLYEVKTVTRPFRAIDIRQLITYAALMAADDQAPVTVGVVNPRLGTFVECPMDRLAEDIAGLHASQLLQQIIFDISAAEIST